MSGHVIPFPARRDGSQGSHGIIHVWGDLRDGYQVSHESASGNSWGEVQTFMSGNDAVAAAHALNRDQYGGLCEVAVPASAQRESGSGDRSPPIREDF